MEYKFAPSLMCMNLLKLEEQIRFFNIKADLLHVDIMDGHFVKNITLSPYIINQINPITKIPIDAHLMVEYPSDFIEAVASAGATYISPHAETINKDAFRIISLIKKFGCKVGLALNPATPIDSIKYYIHLLDKVTVMSVDPGFAGQSFIPEMLSKISELRALKEKYDYSYMIEVDGACNSNTFEALKKAGTEVFIIGSSGLFGLDNNLEVAWEKMQNNFNKEITSED